MLVTGPKSAECRGTQLLLGRLRSQLAQWANRHPSAARNLQNIGALLFGGARRRRRASRGAPDAWICAEG
eukprot:11912323-Alexandrium_andersonii.AAC.1